MKKAYLATAVLSAALLAGCGAETQTEEETTAPTSAVDSAALSEDEKQTYALGASIGMYVLNRLEQQEKVGMNADQTILIAGFEDALAENTQLDMQEIQTLARAGEAALNQAMVAQEAAAGEENKAAGEAFLAENAQKDGVMVTESGLQYEVISEGEGAKPAATDTVTVHYSGTLIDGTEFDSSYSRGEPTSFPLNRVIPGWTEGLQLMNEGSTYRFYIPSNLAYGPRQQGPLILPNSALIFDVELLDIETAGEE